jgi:hypothetical protein
MYHKEINSMGMYDEIGDIDNSEEKMPIGEHPGAVSNVTEDDDKGYVDFTISFLGTTTTGRNRWFLKGDDAVKTKKGRFLIAKQLRNAGFDVTDGQSMAKAIRGLEGKTLIFDVSNRKGSDYQNYWIQGVYIPKRGAGVAAGPDANDDLPF